MRIQVSKIHISTRSKTVGAVSLCLTIDEASVFSVSLVSILDVLGT